MRLVWLVRKYKSLSAKFCFCLFQLKLKDEWHVREGEREEIFNVLCFHSVIVTVTLLNTPLKAAAKSGPDQQLTQTNVGGQSIRRAKIENSGIHVAPSGPMVAGRNNVVVLSMIVSIVTFLILLTVVCCCCCVEMRRLGTVHGLVSRSDTKITTRQHLLFLLWFS
jgi:hypothetical protein